MNANKIKALIKMIINECHYISFALLVIMREIKSIKIHHLQLPLFCCMVVGYYYFGYVQHIGPMSLGVVCLIMLSSLSYLNYCVRSSGKFPVPHVAISILMLLLVLWLYTVNKDELIRLLRIIVIPLILIFSIKEAIRSVRQVNLALIIMAFIVSISCIVAVLQAMDIDFFWNLRMMIGVPYSSELQLQLANRVRTPGLAFYSVPLSYQISAIFPFIIYLIYISKSKKKIIMLGLCVVLGALASKALSSIMSILVCYIVFSKLNNLLNLKRLYSVIAVGIVLILCMTPFNNIASRFTKIDSTAFSRIPCTIIGTKMLLASPSGVKGEEYLELKRHHLRSIQYLPGASYAKSAAFHNCMLNVGVRCGWVVFIGYVLLYVYIFRFIYRAMKNCTIGSADYYFYSSAIAYFCAYIIQSFTHNAGLTTGDPYDWITIGVILAYKPSQINSDECSKNDEKI